MRLHKTQAERDRLQRTLSKLSKDKTGEREISKLSKTPSVGLGSDLRSDITSVLVRLSHASLCARCGDKQHRLR